jgi:hypothetical protein
LDPTNAAIQQNISVLEKAPANKPEPPKEAAPANQPAKPTGNTP